MNTTLVDEYTVTPRQIAGYLRAAKGMGCNCDLDNWEPERSTGHSHVCRIHKTAAGASRELRREAADAVNGPTGDA